MVRVPAMSLVVLRHTHEPGECGVAFAAWNGFESPLRRRSALCSCRHGVHELVFVVEAAGVAEALGLLPPWLAARSEATAVDEVAIP